MREPLSRDYLGGRIFLRLHSIRWLVFPDVADIGFGVLLKCWFAMRDFSKRDVSKRDVYRGLPAILSVRGLGHAGGVLAGLRVCGWRATHGASDR